MCARRECSDDLNSKLIEKSKVHVFACNENITEATKCKNDDIINTNL
jgi:hypothetical protein